MANHRKPLIGIMGPGDPNDDHVLNHAEVLGRRIVQNGWNLVTGGRNAGVMNSASKGAFESGGTVIGILPGNDQSDISEFVTIPVVTGMGSARNLINILTADVIIVCGMGFGTASEAALAIKHRKPVLFTFINPEQLDFFENLSQKPLFSSDNPDHIISKIKDILKSQE